MLLRRLRPHYKTTARTRFHHHHFTFFLQIQQQTKSTPIMDSWSEKSTGTLIKAWGEQYISMNRGNLKQENWETVVETVNTTHGLSMTRVNCKNKLDAVKKKYKAEKAKVDQSNVSSWMFYSRMDYLVGNASTSTLAVSPPVVEIEEEDGLAGMVNAVKRFGSVYERVAKKRAKQTVELEKERMRFSKELEIERMRMLMDMQVQLEMAMDESDDDDDDN